MSTLPLLDVPQLEATLQTARRIAVLGIKPESRRHRSAHHIPAYLADVGYTILPVPVYYPETTEILGQPVFRTLSQLPAPVDILSVFRKPDDFPAHLPDVLTLNPGVVWFQSGLLPIADAQTLADAGIPVAHDCIGCRRATLRPAALPLPGQRPQSEQRDPP